MGRWEHYYGNEKSFAFSFYYIFKIFLNFFKGWLKKFPSLIRWFELI